MRGVVLALAWLGTDQEAAGAERWTVGVRVASYIIYTLIAALAVKTL